MTHQLKTWPEWFQEIVDGNKTFELRKNDRGFSKGDTLLLMEYHPLNKSYTGRQQVVDVLFVMRSGGDFGIHDGYCIMSIKKRDNV